MWFQNLKLLFLSLFLFGVAYPALIWLIGRTMPHRAEGSPIQRQGQTVGYELIGQNFTQPNYFWGRPSAVNYNAAGAGGSNLGPSNPGYLASVAQRLAALKAAHPDAPNVPIDLLTASGSGLDPDISPDAAYLQVGRIAASRKLAKKRVAQLVASHVQAPLLSLFGPSHVNVLSLNLALDSLQ